MLPSRAPLNGIMDPVQLRSTTDVSVSVDGQEDLPRWDLSDLYASPTDSSVERDIERLALMAQDFQKTYRGKICNLLASEWLQMIRHYEALSEIMGRLISYACLNYYQQATDSERARFMGDVQLKLTEIQGYLVFFLLELACIEASVIESVCKSESALMRYRTWIDHIRKMRPHQLSDELERFIQDQSMVGSVAWNRLFDETVAGLPIKIGENTFSLEIALDKLSHPDREIRHSAAEAISKSFAEKINLFTLIMNVLVQDKAISDRWRGFPSPQTEMHLYNKVESEVIEALKNTVTTWFPRLSHRYYQLKARWLGVENLEFWDRNAPLPKATDSRRPWHEAQEIVLSAYHAFDPRMSEIGKRFFDHRWIDAAATTGKSPGAFCHPVTTSTHPRILMTYMGKDQDVMTLAHELGHGIHQVLAAPQGEILASTPLILAETASVFGETLVFNRLLEQYSSPHEKKALLVARIEDMLNTVVRQIAFYEFETRVHSSRKKGELSADALGEIWLSVQKESLGPAFSFDPSYKNWWCYISHFIRTPFYVYAYAFGNSLTNALYSLYRSGYPEFQDLYLNLLRAGGSTDYHQLLVPFGLDARSPSFWERGLGIIDQMITELETSGS